MCNAKKLLEPGLLLEKAHDWGTEAIWPGALLRNLEPHRLALPANILPGMHPVDLHQLNGQEWVWPSA